MAINPQYIVDLCLQDGVLDKDTTLPLADGLVYFYEDESRTTPKLVYQLSGSPPNYTYSPLPNPIILDSAGIPSDADGNQTHIYYYPYDPEGNLQLYYIAVFSALGVEQYTLQGWPNISPASEPGEESASFQNQISNSQFSKVSFNPLFGQVISWTGALDAAEYAVAPDWVLVLSASGTGSVTIEQVSLAGSLGIVTNPPYYLSILPSGSVSKMYLRQRLNHNPDIFSTTTEQAGYISGTMLISSLDGLAHTVSMQYATSSGSMPQTIVSGTTGSAGQKLIQGTTLLSAGTNTDTSDDGYVDIIINLPNVGYITLTSIQIVGLQDDQTIVNYEQEPVNRQVDHLFHYYGPELQYKPIPSYLVGWDFPLNPAQFNGSAGTLGSLGANTSAYVWDCTIVYQQTTNSIDYTRATGVDGLELYATTGTQTAIIQYIPANQLINILSQRICSLVRAETNLGAGLNFTVSIWVTSSTLPDLNSNLSIVNTLDSNGHPSSVNGSWTEITRDTGTYATAKMVHNGDGNLGEYSFSGWDSSIGETISTDANWVAIVVGTGPLVNGNIVVFQQVSMQSGDIPTVPAPQTTDQVLRECQYYYEMSYAQGTIPATSTVLGSLLYQQIQYYNPDDTPQASSSFYTAEFDIRYVVEKYFTPQIVVYPVTGTITANNATIIMTSSAGQPTPASGTNPTNISLYSFFGAAYNSTKSIRFLSTTNTPLMLINTGGGAQPYLQSQIIFQYTADCRPGLIIL